MIEIAGSIVVVIGLWWASTGAILYLDGLPRQTHKWSLVAVTLIGIAGIVAALVVRDDATVLGASIGFAAGLAIWAVPTAAFYLGAVTGPRRVPLTAGMTGLARFRAAFAAVAHHEALCVAGAVGLAVLVADADNRVALWTYLLLFAMHVSGKLNMFLGVPNLSEEFLPPHLAYLTSYMRRRPMNLLFPFALTAATVALVAFAVAAWQAPPGSYDATVALLLAVLTLLAIVEHWLLVLPLEPMALWAWTRPRAPTAGKPQDLYVAPVYSAAPPSE